MEIVHKQLKKIKSSKL